MSSRAKRLRLMLVLTWSILVVVSALALFNPTTELVGLIGGAIAAGMVLMLLC